MPLAISSSASGTRVDRPILPVGERHRRAFRGRHGDRTIARVEEFATQPDHAVAFAIQRHRHGGEVTMPTPRAGLRGSPSSVTKWVGSETHGIWTTCDGSVSETPTCAPLEMDAHSSRAGGHTICGPIHMPSTRRAPGSAQCPWAPPPQPATTTPSQSPRRPRARLRRLLGC